MKKLILVFSVVMSLGMFACNNGKTSGSVVNDSTSVDSVQVDTTQVDSVSIDSVK